MKIRIKPAGKAVILVFCLALLFVIISVTGLLNIFSGKSGQNEIKVRSINYTLNRVLNIGTLKSEYFPGGIFANGSTNTGDSSIFAKKFSLKVSIKDFDKESPMLEIFKKDSLDLLVLPLDLFISNFKSISESNPTIFFKSDNFGRNIFLITKPYITKIKDLAEKRIAVNKNNISYYVLSQLLTMNGVDTKNIKYVFTDSDKQSFEKMGTKEASAFMTTDPNLVKEITKNDKYVNLPISQYLGSLSPQVIIAKDTLLTKHPLLIKYFIDGLIIAADSINKNRGLKKEALSKFYSIPPELLEQISSLTEPSGFSDNKKFMSSGNYISDESFYKVSSKIVAFKKQSNQSISTLPENAINREVLNSLAPEFKSTESEKTEPLKEVISTISPSHQTPVDLNIKKVYETVKSDQAPQPIRKGNESLTLFFTGNSFKLDSLTKISLREFINAIKGLSDSKININGNADSTGEDKYNFMISKWRSDAIADILIKQYNVKKDQLTLTGNGSRKPLASNSTGKGRKLNRRVEILIKQR